jgi:HEPN domain-containing protein
MPHRLKVMNNPPPQAAQALWLRNESKGVFAVRVAERDEHWTPSQLEDFLVEKGYSKDDAEACVAQAQIASEFHITLPSR